MTDLNKKQAFWAEQLPLFKADYICLAQLEAVEFNNETGHFDALTKDATGFDLEDILEAYHSVNTGWAMWLRAKAQAVPEGCVVVPKTPTQNMIKAVIDEAIRSPHLVDFYKVMVEAGTVNKASESGAEG